ncbi:hypothetical protein [Syntrophomonas curvata]
MKRLLWIGGLVILMLSGLLVFNHFYYFRPNLSEVQIKEQAEKKLGRELPDCLRRYTDPYVKTSIHKVEVLDISQLGGKTYLVFKADLKVVGSGQGYSGPFQGGGYMVGIRLVEGNLGGISLKDGMEFTTDLVGGANPAECGQMPNGIFFAFCKDPRIDKVVLELSDGNNIKAEVRSRVVMAQIPRDQSGITPRFYDKEGVEIEPSWGMKIAFVSQNEKYYRQYTNYPLEWWNMNAEDIEVITPAMVNGIWIFPDQQKNTLQKERAKKLLELADAGVPVIFVGMKDFKELEVLGLDRNAIIDPEVPAKEVEALYLGRNDKGTVEAGVITLDDEQDSPVLMKTVNLRYHMDLPGQTKSKAVAGTKTIKIPMQPAAPVVKGVVSGGGR